VVLIGWKGDVKIDLDRMAEKMSNPLIARDLLRMGARSVGDVMGWYMAGPAELEEMGAEAPINTVDRPVLEYTAPKALSLSGVVATMPALLTAYQRVVTTGARQQLDAMCKRRLTSQEQREAESMQQAAQWVMRARLLDSNGSTDQFREAMERAHVIRPQDQAISEGLAEAQAAVAYNIMSDGDLQSAAQLYQQAFANDPTNVSAITGVVQCQMDAGDFGAAHLTLDLVPASRQGNFLVRVYRGLLALTEHDYKSARHWYEEAASGGQESSEMHTGLGIVELKEGHREKARAHFDRALQVATGYLTQCYGIVYGCVHHGLEADAKAYAADLVSAATGVIGSDPTIPSYYQYRALGYTVLGNEALAQRDLETAQSLTGWWANPVPQALPTPPGG
jgi:tetratricopeptide (TPR) repeat protein